MKKMMSMFVILLLLALAACGNPSPQKPGQSTQANGDGVKQITIAGNGGKIEKAIREVIAPKYKEETGIQVNYISGLSGEILSKVELQKNSPQIDIAFFVPLDVQRANDKGLMEDISGQEVPNMDPIDERFFAVDKGSCPSIWTCCCPSLQYGDF